MRCRGFKIVSSTSLITVTIHLCARCCQTAERGWEPIDRGADSVSRCFGTHPARVLKLQLRVAHVQGFAQDTTKAGSNSAPATGENLQAAARDHGGPISGADMAARGATNAAAAATKVPGCLVVFAVAMQ